MVICLGADFERDQLVIGRSGLGLASCDEVGAGSSNGVFDEVGDEEREDEGDEPSEDGDVRFVRARANDEGPYY